MKFVKPSTVPAGDSPSGGYSAGMPSWRRKWLENQVQQVVLECGCIEDLSIPTLLIINAFDHCSIDCVNCGRFSLVKRTLKRKRVEYPNNPLF